MMAKVITALVILAILMGCLIASPAVLFPQTMSNPNFCQDVFGGTCPSAAELFGVGIGICLLFAVLGALLGFTVKPVKYF